MITTGLLFAIAGLAFLDSLNPATIVAVTLILLAAPKRAGRVALAAVSGAALAVFTFGLRFVAFGAAGAVHPFDGVAVQHPPYRRRPSERFSVLHHD